MKKIQNVKVWMIIGAFLVLAIAMPGIFQPTGLNNNFDQENTLTPRAAYDLVYLNTIEGFFLPTGIAVNNSGHVYVADFAHHRVQVFDNTSTYQYSIGVTDVPGKDNAHFNYSAGVAVNKTGHVYVADMYNHRVQVFDKAGIFQYTIGITGVNETDDSHFYGPIGIAVNSTGHIYVADKYNHRVQVFDKAGIYNYTIGGFSDVCAVAVNGSGHVYVADTDNHCVKVFDKAGIYQYTIGVSGVNTPLDNAHFNSTQGIMINETGHVFVADTNNHRVQVFDKAGIYQFTIGVPGAYTPIDNTHLYYPRGLAMNNATKQLYIVDTSNNRVQVFGVPTPTGQTISINDGAADTASTSVTLTLGATGATEMCFSNNGTTYTNWEVFGTTKAWVLSDGLGPKTVYFKTKFDVSEALPVSDSINYILPPTGLSISIDNGPAETGSTSVTLTLSATGATEMCFSNDGVTWSVWEPFATTKQWTLSSESGTKTVYFKARNNTIEAAAPVTDTITYMPGIPGYPMVVLLAAIGLGTLFTLRRAKRNPHL